MRKMIALAVISAFAAVANADDIAEVDGTLVDGILTIDVAEGVTNKLSSAGRISMESSTNVVKTGKGTLIIANSVTGFGGEIHIDEGTIKLTAVYGLGKTGKVASGSVTIFVAKDAAIEYAQSSGVEAAQKVDVAAGGKVLCNVPVTVLFLGGFTIHDDFTFGGAYDLRIRGGVLDLNGHTLTCPKGLYLLDPETVLNPGKVVVTKANTTVRAPTTYSSTDTNLVVSLAAGTKWVPFSSNGVNTCRWTVRFEGNGEVRGFAKDSADHYEGPVSVPEGSTLTVNIGKNMRLGGKVTASKLNVASLGNDTTATLRLDATNSIGSISTTYGSIYATIPESVPSITDGLVTFTQAYDAFAMGLATESNPWGWSCDDITNVIEYVNGNIATPKLVLGVGVDAGETGDIAYDFTGWQNKHYIGAYGGGVAKMKVAQKMAELKHVIFSSDPDSELRLSAADGEDVGLLGTDVRRGVLRLKDAGEISCTDEIQVGISSYKAGMVVDSGTCLKPGSSQYFRLGYATNARGFLEIAGGSVTNRRMYIAGSGSKRQGAVFLRSGELVPIGDTMLSFSANNNSMIDISGGLMKLNYTLILGGYNGGYIAQLRVAGGELVRKGSLSGFVTIGGDGTGVVYQTGGKIEIADAMHLPRVYSATYYRMGSGTATFAGGETDIGGIVLGGRPDSDGTLNVMGSGSVAVSYIKRQYPYTALGDHAITNESGVATTKTYVNFNGGVIKPKVANAELIASGDESPDFTTVFSGGITVDTAGINAEIPVPLVAPPSGSIVSISLPDGALSGYFVAPYVLIEGDGVNATAVAEFDSTNGVVTGVTITSPGWGYTQGATTAKLYGGVDASDGTMVMVDLVVTVGNDAGTGGLTKKGEGTLTLSAANTYSGPTVVQGGTLQIAEGGSLPASSAIALEGGTLSYASGGTLPGNVVFDFEKISADVVSTVNGEVAFPAGAVVTIANAAGVIDHRVRSSYTLMNAANLTGNLPSLADVGEDGWQLSYRGGKLKLVYPSGTAFIIR